MEIEHKCINKHILKINNDKKKILLGHTWVEKFHCKLFIRTQATEKKVFQV